jgi:hypothetical protein
MSSTVFSPFQQPMVTRWPVSVRVRVSHCSSDPIGPMARTWREWRMVPPRMVPPRMLPPRMVPPWMVPPWLDLGFDYRLTYGSDEDGDFAIEVRRQGDAKAAPVRLPGRLTGERAARWRRLARSIAVEDADRDGLLAAAVGRGMFDDVGADDVTVRVLRTPQVDRGGPPRAPVQASSARVRMVGGELQLIRAEPRGEVAPLVRPQPRAAAEDAP